MLATGAVGRRLQNPECGRRMRSHYRNPWSFYFNPTLRLTSAEDGYIIKSVAYITMEWR